MFLAQFLVLFKDREDFAHLFLHALQKGNCLCHLVKHLIESSFSGVVIDHDQLGDSHSIDMDRPLEKREVKSGIVAGLIPREC